MPGPIAMQGVIRQICRAEFRRLYGLLDDSELLARFLADRDEAAFEEIVLRHGPMVRAVCRRMLGANADCDDAFQATFLVMIRRARSIRRRSLLANWLCAVAYRTSRQALRRRWRIGTREQNVEQLPEPPHLDEAPRDWLPLFDNALQKLPGRYRDAIVLCDLEGLSRPDAARKLGLNEGTLSSRLGRGRDLLRKKLVRHGFPLVIGSALAPAVVPEALTASTVAAAMNFGSASVSAIILTEGVLTAMFVTKLKTGAACAAALLVSVLAGLQLTGPATLAGGPPTKEQPQSKSQVPSETATTSFLKPNPSGLAAEYVPFQGDWVVSAADNGNADGLAAVGVDENWKFTGTTLTTGGEAKEDSVEKFVVDMTSKPAKIDFVLTQFTPDGTGRLVRTPFQGIYKFEADGRLVICFRLKTDDVLRPTRFATARNSGATLLSLRRAPAMTPGSSSTYYVPVTSYRAITEPPVSRTIPQPPTMVVPPPIVTGVTSIPPIYPSQFVSGTVVADIEQLQGTWIMLKDGEKPTKPADGREETVEFLKDRILSSDGMHGLVKLDESKSPKQITIVMAPGKSGETVSGIYKIEANRLTIAVYTGKGKLIPTSFEPDRDAQINVTAYMREPQPSTPINPPLVSEASPPVRNVDLPLQAPKRDLLKELDQLREQIKRLEKELKNQKTVPGNSSN